MVVIHFVQTSWFILKYFLVSRYAVYESIPCTSLLESISTFNQYNIICQTFKAMIQHQFYVKSQGTKYEFYVTLIICLLFLSSRVFVLNTSTVIQEATILLQKSKTREISQSRSKSLRHGISAYAKLKVQTSLNARKMTSQVNAVVGVFRKTCRFEFVIAILLFLTRPLFRSSPLTMSRHCNSTRIRPEFPKIRNSTTTAQNRGYVAK